MSVSRLFLTLVLTLFSHFTYPDEFKGASPESSPEHELIVLDDAWTGAEVGADRSALEGILHEDFLATFSSGRTIDRNTFINLIVGSPPAPFVVTHESIRVYGDTAVVIDVSEDGKTKYTWIALKRDGQWRLISETFSMIDTK